MFGPKQYRRPNGMYKKSTYAVSVQLGHNPTRETHEFEDLGTAHAYAEVWSKGKAKGLVVRVSRRTEVQPPFTTKYNDSVGSYLNGIYTPYVGPSKQAQRKLKATLKKGK